MIERVPGEVFWRAHYTAGWLDMLDDGAGQGRGTRGTYRQMRALAQLGAAHGVLVAADENRRLYAPGPRDER